MNFDRNQEIDTESNSTLTVKAPLDPALLRHYQSCMIGAAVFDLSGLPKEYFTSANGATSTTTTWVQTTFQALGLRSLLSSSLQVDGFRHAVIQGEGYSALVVKQSGRYIALLTNQQDIMSLGEPFIQWARQFEPAELRANPRFRVT